MSSHQARMRNEEVLVEEPKGFSVTMSSVHGSVHRRPFQIDETKETIEHEEAKTAPPRRQKPSFFWQYFPTILSLSLFSYAGEFLRFITEELFGLACHKPETSNWSDWAPCTTAPGSTESTGGAFFTDLPANALGCFLMGLWVSGDAELLAVDLPLACLSRDSWFQHWKITHLGLRTGFCGALTTFASWNTQMVIMVCGGDGTALGHSQWVSVLWGYAVGWMIALESFRVGRDCAHALSRHANPHLAREADVIRLKQERSGAVLHVNRELPDFERRFLHDLMIQEDDEPEEEDDDSSHSSHHTPRRSNPKKLYHRQSSLIDDYGSVSFSLLPSQPLETTISASTKRIPSSSAQQLHRYGSDLHASQYKDHIHHLQQWKESTDRHRAPNSPYAQELHEIEMALLVHHDNKDWEPREDLLETIRDAGWNYDALQNWRDSVARLQPPEIETALDLAHSRDAGPWELGLHAVLFVISTALLIWGAVHFHDTDDPVHNNYRTQMLSALLAPPGTILRWLLSKWNGRIRHKHWEWLPIGTLMANLIASIVSVLMPAIELRTTDKPWPDAFMGAFKTGFAGSLSTVSTFAAETVGLFRALPRYFWGYYYSLGSIALAAIVGVCSYVWCVA